MNALLAILELSKSLANLVHLIQVLEGKFVGHVFGVSLDLLHESVLSLLAVVNLRFEALLERLDHHHNDLVAVVLEVALSYSPVLDLFLDSFVVFLEVCNFSLHVNAGEVVEADLI